MKIYFAGTLIGGRAFRESQDSEFCILVSYLTTLPGAGFGGEIEWEEVLNQKRGISYNMQEGEMDENENQQD